MSPRRGQAATRTPAALAAWRVAHGVSQRDLARALGVTLSTIHRWEHGLVPLPAWLDLALETLTRRRRRRRRPRAAPASED